MKIIRQNETQEYFILADNVQISKLIGCSRQTVSKNAEKKEWTFKEFTIIKPSLAITKSYRGRSAKRKINL